MISRRAALLAGGAAVVVAAGGGTVVYRATREKPEPPSPPSIVKQGRLLWRNWSGTAFAYPAVRAAPRDEAELA
ncbi:MAG: FAD-binding protein, partial [Caulobacteraceae bacterium]|nr:FAD-binding protein [Caulobacteraceae bacterium]